MEEGGTRCLFAKHKSPTRPDGSHAIKAKIFAILDAIGVGKKGRVAKQSCKQSLKSSTWCKHFAIFHASGVWKKAVQDVYLQSTNPPPALMAVMQSKPRSLPSLMQAVWGRRQYLPRCLFAKHKSPTHPDGSHVSKVQDLRHP